MSGVSYRLSLKGWSREHRGYVLHENHYPRELLRFAFEAGVGSQGVPAWASIR